MRRLCRLAGRSPMLLSKRQKKSPHSFIKTPNGALNLPSCFGVDSTGTLQLLLGFASPSRSAPRPKVLPRLTGFASAKFPNGRKNSPVGNQGRRILPTRAEPRLKRNGQKTNSAKKAFATFSPSSGGHPQGRFSGQTDAPNTAHDPRSRRRGGVRVEDGRFCLGGPSCRGAKAYRERVHPNGCETFVYVVRKPCAGAFSSRRRILADFSSPCLPE